MQPDPSGKAGIKGFFESTMLIKSKSSYYGVEDGAERERIGQKRQRCLIESQSTCGIRGSVTGSVAEERENCRFRRAKRSSETQSSVSEDAKRAKNATDRRRERQRSYVFVTSSWRLYSCLWRCKMQVFATDLDVFLDMKMKEAEEIVAVLLVERMSRRLRRNF